jgi:RNA 2',3'-cyclic 3'-phosphodiesterase
MAGRDTGAARRRRLFVAVDVPSEVQRAVDRAIRPWRWTLEARWVAPEQRHVTVRFLGAVDADAIDLVGVGVAAAAGSVAPVETRLAGLGAFPSERRARVLWAGIDDAAGRLAAIAAALDAALVPRFPPEPRAFRPHLTLARIDPPLRLPDGVVTATVEPVGFRVDRVVLYESVLGSGPPRYEALEEIQLTG